ncbi:MAG TPA: HDOD domain-containing protein [Steroidobacteraceae bacterium]|jgi:HD-like signal output (HDOD) protein|nr:HDOD domain-containing protein [Steroidobacteraceae bacterium]
MVVAIFVIACLAAGLGIVLAYRHRSRAIAGDSARSRARGVKPPAGSAAPDVARAELANNLVTERLWKLAFAAPVESQLVDLKQAQIRDAVSTLLKADTVDATYLPRRPTLLPQLMRAMDDPSAATDKLARIIAHDPVLAADVLRLANSPLYRNSPAPIETMQRAIVVLGADALRGLAATAMLQPVFRATRSNFPRFPRMLWERTERAARAAEMYALKTAPQDRFEAQLVILLSALGPLVVYGATLDEYSRRPRIEPSPSLCVALTASLGPQVSARMARQWEASPRLAAAIERSSVESLTMALCMGELLGTLSLLVMQQVITADEGFATARDAGAAEAMLAPIWHRLTTRE